MINRSDFFAGCAAAMLGFAAVLPAQTADQAWLRYPAEQARVFAPHSIRMLGRGELEKSAERELRRGLMKTSQAGSGSDSSLRTDVVLGTAIEVKRAFPDIHVPDDLGAESYWLMQTSLQSRPTILLAGGDERGVLYGAFELLRRMATAAETKHLSERQSPAMPLRWVDEWDNADGSIERGYAGRSIFFDAGHVRKDLAPVSEYARLLASIGINGCNLNNVNNAAPFLEPAFLRDVARIADTMRPYGVRIALSVDIASPQKVGGLSTFDPLDPAVKAWWAAKVDEIYSLIPDFAGFTVKADSEGQPGPASYGRTPADAANLLAHALSAHGGVVLYRAFVYNHHLDWHDPKADRARAAYDIFHPLDGTFAQNVIVQTKEGPIDFQAQEPVSPLFSGLEHTSQAMEVQITQEYTGQQRHLVYLAPMWKQVLDFDMRARNQASPVKEILEGKSFHQPHGGMVGVAGIGQDAWLGSPLALANLYAFGRLAWNPNLTPEQIAEEWTRQTLGNDAQVVQTVDAMLMQSWPAYVHYTGPLGMQTLTDITGTHYGPNIEASENNGWGQWHRADRDGVGMDRTVATGTGFAGQYWPQVAKHYENTATTPDDLLTFFHHVPYTQKLHDDKTVIQYIYDSHYQGAEEAARLGAEWATLKGRIESKIFDDMSARLTYQAGHAIVWRDAIVQYFLKLSGIPDAKGRAGHYPGRYEAEAAQLRGYKAIDVTPWEDASGGKAISCSEPKCTATWKYTGTPGRFDVAVQYFDLQGGEAKFTLTINGAPKDTWLANALLPSRAPHGDNSTGHWSRSLSLKPGDMIGIEGTPDKDDPAALDYIEFVPAAQ